MLRNRHVPAHTMSAIDWGLLILLALVWGGSFFFASLALNTWPPFTVVLGRVALGALLLNVVVVLTGHRIPRDPQLWRNLLVMGLLNSVIPFCLIVSGQTQITSGLASILYATTSLFTVLLAPFFVAEERLTVPRLGGVLLGLTGVTLMLGPAAFRDDGAALGKLLVLGGSVSYALGSIWGRRFRGIPSPVAAAGQLTVAVLFMLPLAIVVDRPWTLPPPNLQVIGAIIGLGLFSTTIGYLLYFTILGRAGAVNVSLVTLLVPPSALLLGALFLGEATTRAELAGLVMIALGLLVTDGRVWQAVRARVLGERGIAVQP